MSERDPQQPYRLVFIDDDVALRELAAEGLPPFGFDVVTFASAEDALAAASAFDDADVVASDYHLPEATGLDVSAFVRTRRPQLPLLVLSCDARVAPRVAAAGRPFLAKPVALEVLAATLDRLARGLTT